MLDHDLLCGLALAVLAMVATAYLMYRVIEEHDRVEGKGK